MSSTKSRPGFLEHAKTLARFGRGYLTYLRTGHHDKLSFLAMRELFCATNGRLNDFVAWLHRSTHRPYQLETRKSLISGLDQSQINQVVADLDRDGYHIFSQRLPDSVCKQLIDLALATECTVIGNDNLYRTEKSRFDPDNPSGIKFELGMQEIMENEAAQQVVGDPGLLAVAQAYFRSKAMQDMIAMWWSAPSDDASSAAAQMYHFDMPRIKFLKFFFYLTDVDRDTGPHCFIAGSHRRLPKALRQDKRHTDEEVAAHFSPEKHIEIIGPKGTICAVDTRGLHKGKQLLRGHRLIFQTEFAINLFGGTYPPIELNDKFSPAFLENIRRFPYTFANYRQNGRQSETAVAEMPNRM